MGKIKKLILVIIVILLSANSAHAWVRVVYDKNAIAAVAANTAFQGLIESQDYVLYCFDGVHQRTISYVNAKY